MLRGIMRARLALTFAAVISTLGVTACSSSDSPPSPNATSAVPVVPVAPIAACVSADEQRDNGITATRADGGTVNGLVYGAGRTAVILANEADTDLCGWEPYTDILAEQGYEVLVFNYSNRPKAQDDVLAGVAALRQRGATRVFLIGASMGGTMSLAAAAVADPPVSGVVSLSGPSVYNGTDALALMSRLTVPAIFAAGASDSPFADNERALCQAAASTDKQLVIQQNTRHGVALLDQDTLTLIEDFLSKHSAT
jgi:pimeloyl-ACP methyl ester carboxylesterase